MKGTEIYAPKGIEHLKSIADILAHRAEESGTDTAYNFLPDGESVAESITYAELDLAARQAAAFIRENTESGDRVLLLFPSGIEFIKAFYGCIYAGVTGVPCSLPSLNRSAERIQAIADDCNPTLIIAAQNNATRLNNKLSFTGASKELQIVPLEFRAEAELDQMTEFPEGTPVFLQYTSGSTSTPKGVRVTMPALLENNHMVAESFGYNRESRVVSWLPVFHDMGLISSILQPVFSGCQAYIMPPAAFVQRPMRWLEAIERFGGTIAGGPDFGYRLCLEKISAPERENLDLSSWETAFNGAEPVRNETVQEFSAGFADSGFRQSSFLPCYGLAETVVFVSGSRVKEESFMSLCPEELSQGLIQPECPLEKDSITLVGSGSVAYRGQEIRIIDPETLKPSSPNQVGEIWVRGPHVADGYWENRSANAETYGAHPADELDGAPYLRTGDLGFLREDILFVCGRLKDLIILRGSNYYPQDLEYALENAHDSLRGPGFAAAFVSDESEKLIAIIEVDRTAMRDFQAQKVGNIAAAAIAESAGLVPDEIVFIRFNGAPRTTSGKIQRRKAKNMHKNNELPVIDTWKKNGKTQKIAAKMDQALEGYLAKWITNRMKVSAESLSPETNFSVYGVDSVMAAELTRDLEKFLGQTIDIAVVYDNPTITSLAEALQNPEIQPAQEAPQAKTQTDIRIELPSFRSSGAPKKKTVSVDKKPATGFVLADFSPWRSEKLYKQQDLLDYTAWITAVTLCHKMGVDSPEKAEEIYQDTLQRVQRYGVSPESISRRQFNAMPASFPDSETPETPLTHGDLTVDYRGRPLEERMKMYGDLTYRVMEDLYRDTEEAPKDIVHVSCSGYLSPSPAQRLAAARNWFNTRVTHSYHMGCYGAFPAQRIATGLRGTSQELLKDTGRVDIMHTEYLSVHLDFTKNDPGHLIDMTLFADGFIRYSLFGEENFRSQNRAGLLVRGAHEVMIPDSTEAMTWTPGSHQFGMYLSKDVPLLIRDGIKDFTKQLCQNADIDYETEKSNLYFAVHPGGPRILDHIRDALELEESQIKYGRDVLYQYGNMSSATVPHIWKNMLEDDTIPKGAIIVSMAFGPGLTATGSVMEKI